MSKIHFYKYQGTGNDFIIMNGKDVPNKQAIRHLCNRRFGIGADGLFIMNRSKEYDFDMLYFNSDGSKSFCGNGSRCAVQFANHMGWINKKCVFHSNDGVHEAYIKDKLVYLKMHDIQEVIESNDHFEINTGSPHYLSFKNEIQDMDIIENARSIRYSEPYKQEGINVNFLESIEGKLHIRTYERGVEDETLSCGTGVTAAALANHIYSNRGSGQFEELIITRGGQLRVKYEKSDTGFRNIYLCGPAEFVFEGKIDLNPS